LIHFYKRYSYFFTTYLYKINRSVIAISNRNRRAGNWHMLGRLRVGE